MIYLLSLFTRTLTSMFASRSGVSIGGGTGGGGGGMRGPGGPPPIAASGEVSDFPPGEAESFTGVFSSSCTIDIIWRNVARLAARRFENRRSLVSVNKQN